MQIGQRADLILYAGQYAYVYAKIRGRKIYLLLALRRYRDRSDDHIDLILLKIPYALIRRDRDKLYLAASVFEDILCDLVCHIDLKALVHAVFKLAERRLRVVNAHSNNAATFDLAERSCAKHAASKPRN